MQSQPSSGVCFYETHSNIRHTHTVNSYCSSNLGRLSLPSLRGSVNEDQLRLVRQRQVWFIPFVGERMDVQVKP